MRALVFADRSAAALAPLDAHYATALLPVAGKELILYTVEDLVGAGIRDLTFVLADQADRLERLLGDGQRWGARFRFVLSRGAEPPGEVWPRLKLDADTAVLVTRGDLLRGPAVRAFLDAAQGQAGALLCGRAADPRASLLLLRPGHGDPRALLGLLDSNGPATGEVAADVTLPLGDIAVAGLDDLPGYHRANLDLVAGRLAGLAPAGREIALGLITGRRAAVSPRSLKAGQAYVGDNSRVSPEAELHGEVMIARDVVVDRAATVFDSVILPHSYVGELVDVGNAIVSGDLLIRVDTGAVLHVTDAFLLGNLNRDGGAAAVLDRIGGLALLLLSLPLWPLAVAAAALQHGGGQPWQTEMLVGNRRSAVPVATGSERAFFTWRFNTRVPVLATLPRLLAVITGDLRLVGVAPLTPREADARTEDWQRVRDQAPVGLIGPTQLLLPAGAPLDERLMSDAFYAGQRRGLADLRWLWEGLLALFGPRAWSGAPTA